MGTRLRSPAVLAAVLLAGCSQQGSITAPQRDTGGPVQDVSLVGDPAIHMTSSSDPAGVVHAPPAASAGTGCFSWVDASGAPHWQAQVSSGSGGRRIGLRLSAPRVPPGPGTHPVFGASGAQDAAVLSVDGTDYPGVHLDPGDAMPSYFTIDGDGTTGLISVRFAAVSGGPQAFYAVGRWRCA